MIGALFSGAQKLAGAAAMASDQLDVRAKKYAAWILENICKGDASKIVGAKVVVNPRTDGFGVTGG